MRGGRTCESGLGCCAILVAEFGAGDDAEYEYAQLCHVSKREPVQSSKEKTGKRPRHLWCALTRGRGQGSGVVFVPQKRKARRFGLEMKKLMLLSTLVPANKKCRSIAEPWAAGGARVPPKVNVASGWRQVKFLNGGPVGLSSPVLPAPGVIDSSVSVGIQRIWGKCPRPTPLLIDKGLPFLAQAPGLLACIQAYLSSVRCKRHRGRRPRQPEPTQIIVSSTLLPACFLTKRMREQHMYYFITSLRQ